MNYQDDLDVLNFITVAGFIISIYSLVLAVQNLLENRIQTADTKQILDRLNVHLAEQDKHLAAQDELLKKGVSNEGS